MSLYQSIHSTLEHLLDFKSLFVASSVIKGSCEINDTIPLRWNSFWRFNALYKLPLCLYAIKIFSLLSFISSLEETNSLTLSMLILNPIPKQFWSLELNFFTKSSYLPPFAIIIGALEDDETSEKVNPLYSLYLVPKVGSYCTSIPFSLANGSIIANNSFRFSM